LAFAGASGAVGATAAWASAIGESDLGLKRVIPPSAEANAKVRGAGSPGASVQSAGNRRFTISDGGISAKVRATVEDGSAGSPARVLEPANRPPTVAPPRRARHAITPVLIRLDRPRMSTHARCPQWPSSCFQTERNYGCGGTFLRSFLCSARGLRPMTRQCWPCRRRRPWMTEKARRFRRALSSREREDCGLCRLFLHYRLFVLSLTLGRLRTSAGTLGKGSLNLLDRFGLGDALHRRDLA